MVAMTGFAGETRSRVTRVESKRPSIPVRATSIVFGFACIWAGISLWLFPVLNDTSLLLLTKMGASILLVTFGVCMTQVATNKPHKELHFDPRHKQLLVYESLPRGRKHVLQAVDYDQVGRVDVSDRLLEVRDEAGDVLVSLPIDGAHARLDAIAQLRSQSIFPG